MDGWIAKFGMDGWIARFGQLNGWIARFGKLDGWIAQWGKLNKRSKETATLAQFQESFDSHARSQAAKT